MDEKLEALRLHVMQFCGWKQVSVKLNGRVLVIECETGLLVSYNLATYHEVYGRLSHVGYNFVDLVMLGFELGGVAQPKVEVV